MAHHTLNKDGNIVQTDILVYGYIRQDIQHELDREIPNELYVLCFTYWLYNVCDSWCADYHKENVIKIDGDTVTTLYDHERGTLPNITLYGNHVVRDGSTYEWKIRMNRFGYYNPGSTHAMFVKLMNPEIGIIINDKDILQKYAVEEGRDLFNWAGTGYGYVLAGGFRLLRSKNHRGFDLGKSFYKGAAKERFNTDNDSISVHLDLVNHTLAYTINDNYCGIAFKNVTPNDYRLAISLTSSKSESIFQLL